MEEKKRIKKEKKVSKAPKVQTIFCVVSLAFILGCCCFYGNRLIKYYKIYNPKDESGETLLTLSASIINNSSIVYEGDGLYLSGGNYVYKGKDVNNYILLSNMLFRIVKINNDKTIDLVLDDYLNKLEWNDKIDSFDNSSLSKYLNEKFLSILDQNLLVKTSLCSDTIPELNEITCDKITNNNYVRVLGINEFLNSISNDNSYLIKNREYLWLYNTGKTNAWHTNGISIGNDVVTKNYGVKPVITLKNSVVLLKGDGSINDPYQVKEVKDKLNIGTYLDLNDQIYTIYEVGEDYLKVEANLVLKDLIFDNQTNEYSASSLKDYLENTYLKKLGLDSILKEVSFGEYKGKVGLLTKDDFKFNDTLRNYYLLDKDLDNVLLYNGSLRTSKVNVKRNVRPSLGIKKELKIISGNGSKMAPFIVEV